MYRRKRWNLMAATVIAATLHLTRFAIAQTGTLEGKLLDATGRGRSARVAFLLRQGANPNTTDDRGHTAVSYAVSARDERAVRLLLEHGAKPDLTGTDGITPLMDAAGLGLYGTVSLLLKHGASSSTRDSSGRTALIWAADSGRPATVKVLLQWRADPNARDLAGKTPLHWAVIVWSDMNKLKSASESRNQTIFDIVRPESGLVYFQRADDYMTVHHTDRANDTAVISAAQADYAAVVTALRSFGARTDVRDEAGRTVTDYIRGEHNAPIRRALSQSSSAP